ncbi:hypothetical protein [Catellatospora citrea]|nr:hypothetical protein [Catellatospora citrea]
MTVQVEVWPVAADEHGIWLLSGQDAWRPATPVPGDSEPHAEVELALTTRGVCLEALRVVHSTSWRTDGPGVMLTYMALVTTRGLVRDGWPEALPLSARVADAVGKPPTNAAVEAPAPRYIDVLMHGLRHLRFLVEHDATASAAMGESWHRHLAEFEPALAGMYSEAHQN